MATAEARGGTAALAPASQRASEIQRVLRDAREARERAGQAKWTSNTGLTRGTHGTQDLHLHTKTASTNPTSPPPVPPAPRPASTNPTPPPSAAPEKLGLGAVGLDLPKLQHNVSAPSHTGTPGDEAEQRAVREQVLSLQQQVSALQQAAKQAGSRPAASTAEASDTAAAAVQELISHEPQKRLSREEVLDVLETEDAKRQEKEDYHCFLAQLNLDSSFGTAAERRAASQSVAGSQEKYDEITHTHMPIQTSPNTPRLRPSLPSPPITCDLIRPLNDGRHRTVPEQHPGRGFIEEVAVQNGGIYTGEFEDGKRHGLGITQYPNGATHEGNYCRDLKHGVGAETLPTGDRYEGQYEYDRLHGTGTYRWTDGRVYTGMWSQGCIHGNGVYSWPDGQRLEGVFKKDAPVKGYLTSSGGRRSKVYFEDGCRTIWFGQLAEPVSTGKGLGSWLKRKSSFVRRLSTQN